MKKISISLFFLVFLDIYAQVEPPNYNFSIRKFEEFKIGNTFEKIDKQYKKGSFKVSDKNGLIVMRYNIEHLRYKFPIFVNFYQGKVVDYVARLPSYFIHDVFHQSLINSFGKQDKYFKVENNALYIWKNEKNMKFTYSGTCTITCFPIFFAMEPVKIPDNIPNYQSILRSYLLK